MKLTITQSGLKAFTKEHGLTEYWSHRVTYCLASPQFPRIFCWVYRHEGRKLKQELRCHAVVCSKESVARQIADQLQSRLAQALNEFRRDKISRQNARLSLANSVYENPSLPRRKILLSTGSHNYRPPLERSKSAPRLMSIEESLEEDEEPCAVAGGVVASAFRRCRADSRLRTGTLRNRLGGLHGYHRDAAAVVTAAVTSAAVGSSGGAAEVAGTIEDRLAKSLRLRDDDAATAAVTDPTVGLVAAERTTEPSSSPPPPPSYRDAVAADDEDDDQLQFVVELSPAVAAVCGLEQQQQQQLPPKYNEVIVDCPQGPEDVCYKYNSLVRDRKRLFESIGGGGHRDQFKRMSSDSELLGAYNNLVKNRKLLFESCGHDGEDDEEDLDVDLLEEDLDEDKDCGYPDDESTPSLQSISSGGSDACKKIAMDLDSLSEEDSDESGYVEAPPSRCPADAMRVDDKEKDLHKRGGNGHLKVGGGAACRNPAVALRRVVGV